MAYPLVAIEGIDGAGKSTLARGLTERIGGVVIKFPDYDTEVGSRITSMLHTDPDPITLQCLMTINRIETIPQIQDALQTGPVVLDRYWQSAIAYGKADGVGESWLLQLQSVLPSADLNILIDCSVQQSFCRRPERTDAYEKNVSRLTAARDNYLALWGKFSSRPDAWLALPGLRSEQQVKLALAAYYNIKL